MNTQKPSVRIGTRYGDNRVEAQYDSIVIGSGMGGLTTATCLAKLGHKVCVLEQHYTAGGFTHAYENQGFEWDIGVHYIGDVGSDKTLIKKLFDFVSDKQLKWQAMDDCFDRIFLDGKAYELMAGKEKYIQSLIEQFPDEAQAIHTYIKALKQTRQSVRMLTLAKFLPSKAANLLQKRQHQKNPHLSQTTREVLESITQNQTLIAVLTGQWGDCGLPPAESSFIIHALIAHHYINGGYYPIGGASQIARSIMPNIEQAGGQVFTYANVKQILFKGKTAIGVEMQDGKQIFAKQIISNAGVYNTFTQLIPKNICQQSHYLQKLKQVNRSMASMCLYIGLNDTADNLELPKTNLWIYPNKDYEASLNAFKQPGDKLPVVYISFPSAKDPSFTKRYPYKATIEIVAPCYHEWFEQWERTSWQQRGAEYEALKAKLSEQLLEYLYEKLPQLKGKIAFHELSTTLSTDYFCRYKKGEIYGLDHTPERFKQTWLRPKTEFKGLYLTGQDIVTCGVAGALISGLLTTISIEKIKGIKLAKQIMLGKS